MPLLSRPRPRRWRVDIYHAGRWHPIDHYSLRLFAALGASFFTLCPTRVVDTAPITQR